MLTNATTRSPSRAPIDARATGSAITAPVLMCVPSPCSTANGVPQLPSGSGIERQIGAGAMATVYLAHDLKHDRDVAIKVLKAELNAVLGAERFLREIKVTANLQHPNLLPLFDSGEVDGLLYYVMSYIEGETLRARLEREKQLPIDGDLMM